jgi:hypothetical protein
VEIEHQLAFSDLRVRYTNIAESLSLTCGLLVSASRISGGLGGGLFLAWRVGGSVTHVAVQDPGDGPRPPAKRRATGVPLLGACGTVAEHLSPKPGKAAQRVDTGKKLLS